MNHNLNPHTLQSAAGILQCLNVHKMEIDSDRIRCSCPLGILGKHYHSNRNLSNPACEVTVSKGANESTYIRYYCYSCSEYGDLEILPYEMIYWARKNPEEFSASYVKERAAKALEYLLDYQIEGATVSAVTVDLFAAKEFSPYSEAWLSSYPPALQNPSVTKYLYSRGLSDEIIVELDIRAYSHNQYLYAGFPYRNIEGVLAGMRGRGIDDDYEYSDEANEKRGWKLLKHRPIKPIDFESNESLVWYREDRLDLTKPVLIVEGQFDVASILPLYRNVTCLFTSNASPIKLSFFNDSAGVIILLDNDKDGSPAHEKIIKSRQTMGKYFTTQKTKYLQAFYPKGCKDAGEMSPDNLVLFITSILTSM